MENLINLINQHFAQYSNRYQPKEFLMMETLTAPIMQEDLIEHLKQRTKILNLDHTQLINHFSYSPEIQKDLKESPNIYNETPTNYVVCLPNNYIIIADASKHLGAFLITPTNTIYGWQLSLPELLHYSINNTLTKHFDF